LIHVGSTLYSTTFEGGAHCLAGAGCGTVFALDPGSGAETVLSSFCSQANCTDGDGPSGTLLNVKGTLYGTTEVGGTNNNDMCGNGSSRCGTVFSLNPNTRAETILYSFCSLANCADGAVPNTAVIAVVSMRACPKGPSRNKSSNSFLKPRPTGKRSPNLIHLFIDEA
jgi:uncharacterized repeat protein (TIGR03803 family)